jgi:hypothetical protein
MGGKTMDIREIKKLAPGDEVYWEDPDEGACSRYITIRRIDVGPSIIQIYGTDGSYLECFSHELK